MYHEQLPRPRLLEILDQNSHLTVITYTQVVLWVEEKRLVEEQVVEAEELGVKAEVVVLEPRGGNQELDMQRVEGAPRSEIDDRLTDSG